MIIEKKDSTFNPKFEVVGCYIEKNGKILFLKRQFNKDEPNKYGVPAGKKEENESIYDAIYREVKEETGIILDMSKIVFYKTKFVKYKKYDFIYHMFYYNLNKDVDIRINKNEHQDYLWVSPSDSLKLDLIEDEDMCIKDYFNLK